MNARLRALLAKKQAKIDAAKALTAAAGENELSAEDQVLFDAAMDEAQSLQASIDRERALIEAERSQPGLPSPVSRLPHITVDENIEQDPRRGFAHVGQFTHAVVQASRGVAFDQRLMTLNAAAATTVANESTGADGGFTVPPQYSQELMTIIEAPDSLLSRCRQIPISGTTLTIPKNETAAHSTTGVQAYWDDEMATIQQSRPVFKFDTLRTSRITALVPASEELLQDSPAMAAWFEFEAGAKMAFKTSDAILWGTGGGMPLGIMGAPCLVTQAKESSQANGTLLTINALKMLSRLTSGSRSRAVWVMHSDMEPLLPGLFIPIKNVANTDNVGGAPIYAPPSAGQAFGTLLGRPILFSESSQSVGALGDIVLADFSQYIVLTKGGVKSDQSIHLWFDQNLHAFRFVLRLGGQPWLSAPIARKNGTNTQSHFVTLQARS